MTEIRVGQTYFGPQNARLTVTKIEGKKVHVLHPISLREEVITRGKMLAWAAASDRRTYRHSTSGEVRTKLSRDPAGDVTYMDATHRLDTVSGSEWAAWRRHCK